MDSTLVAVKYMKSKGFVDAAIILACMELKQVTTNKSQKWGIPFTDFHSFMETARDVSHVEPETVVHIFQAWHVSNAVANGLEEATPAKLALVIRGIKEIKNLRGRVKAGVAC